MGPTGSLRRFGRSPAAARRVTLAIAGVVAFIGACSCEETGRSAIGTPVRPEPEATASPVPITTEATHLPVQTRDGELEGVPTRAEGSTVENVRRTLDRELARYPAEFLRRIGLKQVVLCDGLTFEGRWCSAFTDVERGQLYLSLDSRFDASRLRWVIHHETFHQLDYADDHRLDADPRWEALNAPGFRYSGDSERLKADENAARPDAGLAGFLNLYSTSSPSEDKAEVYACLIVDPVEIARRAATDEVLRRKVERTGAMIDRIGPYRRQLLGR